VLALVVNGLVDRRFVDGLECIKIVVSLGSVGFFSCSHILSANFIYVNRK
jgi:hypothetical protein